MKDARLDQKDHVILDALKKDARKTIAELSHALGIPRATVHERITKLRRLGVIKRFTIEQDYKKTGLPTLAFVFASCDRTSKITHAKIAAKLSGISGIYGVYLISGEWDILIKVRGKSIEDIGMHTLERIRKSPGIFKTHAVSCFDTVLDEF